jgi:NTE family protein
MTSVEPKLRPAGYDKTIGLVLQGGGALGSYQAGVYEALAASDYLPDWVAGISIGAINAAIIAGNPVPERVERLRQFWQDITAPTAQWPAALLGSGSLWQWPITQTAMWQQSLGANSALLFGQPGFFTPRAPHDWLSTPKPLSFYSTDALKETLERLVDFDRINDGKDIRLSVGAVNVRTGNLTYFDSSEIRLRAEHIMASGALPPGFPPVEIDGEHYWDGGLVSNTPLRYVLDYYPRRSRLAFQVDVFQGYGRLPSTLDEVMEREKDIRYSSRTKINTTVFQQNHEIRHAINELEKLLPPEIAETEEAKRLHAFGCVTAMDVAQLIYRPREPQGSWKDYEFSRKTMTMRWEQGKADALVTLAASPWLAPSPREVGVRVFDVVHDILVAQNSAGAYAKRDEHEASSPAPAGQEPQAHD